MKKPTFLINLKYLLLYILFFGNAVTNFLEAQNDSPQVTIALTESPENSKGSATGDGLIQYNGYTLSEIFQEIDAFYSLKIEHSSLKDERLDFTYKGPIENKQAILDQLSLAVQKEFGANYYKKQSYREIYRINYLNEGDCLDQGLYKSTKAYSNKFFNDYNWSGKCVTMDDIGKIMQQWYDDLLIIPGDTKKIASIELEKKELADLITELKTFGIEVGLDSNLSNRHVMYVFE